MTDYFLFCLLSGEEPTSSKKKKKKKKVKEEPESDWSNLFCILMIIQLYINILTDWETC